MKKKQAVVVSIDSLVTKFVFSKQLYIYHHDDIVSKCARVVSKL